MRYWKKLVAGGAAMLVSVGSAYAGQEPSAVERVGGVTTSAGPEASWDAKGRAPSDPARAMPDAVSGDGSGFVTHDELEKDVRTLIERLERERNAQVPAPTFTDAG
jgi:hypothetical protein